MRLFIGVCLAALVLGGCGKSPEEVCDLLYSLARPDDNFKRATCLAEERRKRSIHGSSWYRGRSRCVLRATSYAAALGCRGTRVRHRRRRRGEHRINIRAGTSKPRKRKRKRKRKR
jgi:hypothetical protein